MSTARPLPVCEHAWRGLDEHLARHQGQPCPYLVMERVLSGLSDPREDVRLWTLPMPWPIPPLSLNQRMHHHQRAVAVRSIKARVQEVAMEIGLPPLPRVHVELHYRPKANIRRDQDNLVATLKPCIDALHHPEAKEGSGWVPVLAGDDPRYVTWSPPCLHPAERRVPSSVWLELRSYDPAGLVAA